MMTIKSFRQVRTARTDERRLAFIELLTEPKNKNLLNKASFPNIKQKSIYIEKVLMLDRQFGGLIGKLFLLVALLFVEKTKV